MLAHFFSTVWAWLQDGTHRGLLIALLPTVITGFLKVKGLEGVAYWLAQALRFLSIVTPKDVRGTWQAPLGLWAYFRPTLPARLAESAVLLEPPSRESR